MDDVCEFNDKIDHIIERLVKMAPLVNLKPDEERNADCKALSWAITALADWKDGGWISVFDRLPNYLTNCIVYTQDDMCCVARLSEVDDKWYDENDLEVNAVWWRELLPYPPDTPYGSERIKNG